MQLSEQIPTRLEIHTRLTPRECEIVILLSEGMKGPEIAFRLGLTPRMVAGYRSAIRHKWDVRNTEQLIRMAIRLGIVGAE
jgi:DNA-binding NarL/FixJ family response regulator